MATSSRQQCLNPSRQLKDFKRLRRSKMIIWVCRSFTVHKHKKYCFAHKTELTTMLCDVSQSCQTLLMYCVESCRKPKIVLIRRNDTFDIIVNEDIRRVILVARNLPQKFSDARFFWH